MADDTALALRMLRLGLKAASRAGASVVDRVLKSEVSLAPPRLKEPAARKREAGPVEVRFGANVARVRRGSTVLEAAEAARVDLRHYCGGNCSCGTCRVVIVSGARNLSRPEGMEKMVLGSDASARGDRLACQAQVLGDVEIRIPEWF
ncbi:MAG: 2Fe-2S iron-sulfur cluster-binding protein [Myxococcota bacterium]